MNSMFQVRHRHGVNRNGKKFVQRHAALTGYVAVDSQTKAWSYMEGNSEHELKSVISSPNWKPFMENLAPAFEPVSAQWAQRIQLRQRAFN